MTKNIFIIGPGGAGKSTVGPLLANIIGYAMIDLDEEFCIRIENVRAFIKRKGYEAYLIENSRLLMAIIDEQYASNSVIVLSSGCLSTDIREDIVRHNREIVSENGVSVLILPSEHFEIAQECIIDRQLRRGYGLVRKKEMQKIRQRFFEYKEMGDHQVFSQEEPEIIARKIVDILAMGR